MSVLTLTLLHPTRVETISMKPILLSDNIVLHSRLYAKSRMYCVLKTHRQMAQKRWHRFGTIYQKTKNKRIR